ncbi:hypothetical protein BM1_07378 [Bipolaris maydis]|nr:hypothetical protein BM1_07378 [Bipolaris maydis]
MNDLFGRESSFGDEIFEEPVICSPMTQAELDNSISFEGLAESTTIKLVAPSEENREGDAHPKTQTIKGDGPAAVGRRGHADGKRQGGQDNGHYDQGDVGRIQGESGIAHQEQRRGQEQGHTVGAPFATVEKGNETTAKQTSSRSLHENLEAGVTKAKGTVGGTASKTREWSKSYFDVNRSQPVSFLESDGKSSNFNGVKWNMEHNHLAGDGVKLELLLYLLLTRQDDSKYAVKITAEVDTAKLFGHKEHKCVIRAIPKELGHTEPAVSYLQGKKMWQKLDVNHFEALLSPDMDTSLKLPWDLEEMAGTKNEDVQDGHEEDDSGEEEVEGENDDAAAVSWTEEQAEHSAEGKSARTAKRRDVTTPLEDSAAILDALLRLSAAEGGSNSYGQEEDTPTRIAMLESSQSIWPRVIRRGRVKRRDATIPLDKSAAKLDTLHGMSERATVPTFSDQKIRQQTPLTHQQAQAYFMEAKLKTAIGKWRNPSYKDNIEFQKELEPLYRSLVATTHNTLGQEHGQQLIKNSLEEDSELMDRCVRWHLLQLVIRDTQTSDAHMKLAKTIMASERNGWDLLFHSPSGKKMEDSCKRGTAKQEKSKQQRALAQNQPKQQTGQQASTMAEAEARTTQRHGKNAVYNGLVGGPPKNASTAEGREGAVWDDAIAEFTKLVLLNNKQFHRNIIDHRTTAHLAFNYALCEIPTILQGDKKDRSQDQELLDGVIKYTYLNLAIAILASKYHCNQLTMREHVVKAMDNWISKKDEQSQRALLSGNDHNQDDDNPSDYNDDDENIDDNDQLHDDGVGDDEENCRKLVIQVLSHTPEDVLRSPEVLTKVMQHNLLNDADILKAYAKVAKDDIKTSKVPFASFKPVASLLKDVPGILHMAVFYQQQPLVETLLRCNAQLAVIRAYTAEASTAKDSMPCDQKVQNADSGFYPLWFNNKVKREANSDEQNRMWKEIRSALIYCVMKHAENVQTLLNALRESGENEINFDMSRLLIEGTNVADFVKLMPQQKRSYNLIRYEETIRYTQPQTPAAQNRQRSHLQRTHKEILDMVDWFAKHGVRRIITLRVPDRMAHPHDELEIARVVRRFRIEELDWRFLDLSLNIFKPHGEPEDIPLVCPVDEVKDNKPEKTTKTGKTGKHEKGMQETYLRRLHLYTGGRRSVLDHWFSSEGLKSMNLEHVHIHVIKELTTEAQSNTILRYINTKIEELRDDKRSMQIEVESQFWTAQTETPRLQEICVKASRYHDTKGFQPAKVAIIDNGILSMDSPSAPPSGADSVPYVHGSSGTGNNSSKQHLQSQEFLTPDSLWARICDGKPFVYEQKRVSPWYLASNPHGTMLRMASCNMYGKLLYDFDDNTIDDPNKKVNQYDFRINSQDVAVGAIPFLTGSTDQISGSSVATAIAAGLCSLLIACLRTLKTMTLDEAANGNKDHDTAIEQMRNNIKSALMTKNRPTHADIMTYLATMAPSPTNPKFISLDRFAHLEDLRDVNTSSPSKAFQYLATFLSR